MAESQLTRCSTSQRRVGNLKKSLDANLRWLPSLQNGVLHFLGSISTHFSSSSNLSGTFYLFKLKIF